MSLFSFGYELYIAVQLYWRRTLQKYCSIGLLTNPNLQQVQLRDRRRFEWYIARFFIKMLTSSGSKRT